MISKIDSINNFGIYKKFGWSSEIPLFNVKNIIYGWNYSGKTTFSRIFSSLRDREIYKDFTNGDFKITMNDGTTYTKSNIKDFHNNVLVFNSDYIRDNLRLDYEGDIDAIFFEIGDVAKISNAIEKLDKLILEIEGSETIVGKKTKYQKTIEDYEIFENVLFTTEAKKIKDDHFISLINFTKANIRTIKDYIINNIEDQIIKDKDVLAKTSKTIKIEKPKLEIEKITFLSNYNSIKKELDEILKTSPAKSDIIEILDKRQDVYNWVQKGIVLHSGENKCFFCDNPISNKRIDSLNLYFENQASELRGKCRNIKDQLISEIEMINQINFPSSHNDFNEGFQDEFVELKKEIDKKITSYIIHLQELIKKIDEKSEKKIYTSIPLISSFKFSEISDMIEQVNSIIKNNNIFSENFTTIISSERDRYKNHLVASFLKGSNYLAKKEKAEKAYEEIAKFDIKIDNYKKAINRLLSLKESDTEGGVQLQYFIQSFLGREDIEIKLNEDTKKYNLLRGSEIARNLSEGEKMAISFSHFLVTIKSIQDKNQFDNYIIFIDDPISSLDGNHIFQINSLLKETFYDRIIDESNPKQKKWVQKCLQLFISTHNFDFFNLLKELPKKDGLLNSKENRNKESRYFISRNADSSIIENLPSVYNDFQSEYHYLFSEIMAFHENKNRGVYPKLLLIPNILRRFLEMYTLTQYPARADLDQRADEIFGETISKRICKPFHYFSHFNNIDRITKQSEYIVDVGAACDELINFLESRDSKHYQALKQSISK